MYAIVDIAGQQFKVEKDKKLYVHRLESDAGSEILFDRVLLIENNGKVTIGDPVIKNAVVSANVVEHVKGDKVLVFKKKRRKGYKKLNGHRQYLTRIEITGIDEKAEKKATSTAAENKPGEATKTETKAKAASVKDTVPEKTGAKVSAERKQAENNSATTKKEAPVKKAASDEKPAATKETPVKKAASAKKTAANKPAEKKGDSGEKSTDKK